MVDWSEFAMVEKRAGVMVLAMVEHWVVVMVDLES